MKAIVSSGCVRVRPVIERRYTLSEVPAALAYRKERHANGKLDITT
jgi:NADPH:quinone reductase-like Zn-dependent oxidoreductase